MDRPFEFLISHILFITPFSGLIKPEIVFLEDCNLLLADLTDTSAITRPDMSQSAFNVIARSYYKYLKIHSNQSTYLT